MRGLDAAGKEGLVRGLLDAFLAEMAPLIAAVRQALGEGSAGGLASAAHAIKGAAANLGAPALAALSARLEKHGRSGTLPEVKALAQELEREFRRVCQVMEGELGHQAARLVRARHAPAGTPRPDVAADPRVGRRVGRGVRQLPKE